MKRVLVVIALLGLVACGNDDDGSADTTTTTEAASATSTTGTPTSTTLAAFGNTPVSRPDTSPPSVLTDVRLGSHEGFERVVFQFGKLDVVPGYKVEHASGPFTQDASGADVAVSGGGHIAVRLSAAAHNEAGQTTYVGPKRIPGRGSVTEVVMLGDFEGVVSWVIGTTADRPFRVFSLQNPARVVIDIST